MDRGTRSADADATGVFELTARRTEQQVYVLVENGVVLAAAQVTPARPDDDPDPPDRSQPSTLVMAAAAIPGRGHAAHLIEQVRDRVHPDLAHDGCLSNRGALLVDRLGIPILPGKKPELLSDERAAHLAAELTKFARANPSGVAIP